MEFANLKQWKPLSVITDQCYHLVLVINCSTINTLCDLLIVINKSSGFNVAEVFYLCKLSYVILQV